MTKLYNEALAVLDELKLPGSEFPADIYEGNGIRAIIAAHKGQIEKARKFAQVALDAAAREGSGFRYHPNVGTVKDRDSKFYHAIEAIAVSNMQSFAN